MLTLKNSIPFSFVVLLNTATLDVQELMLKALSANIDALKTARKAAATSSKTSPPPPTSRQDKLCLVEHVSHLPGFDDTLYNGVLTELTSLQLKGKGNKVLTQWLSPSNDSYNYGKIVNKPKDINKFTNISKLMDIVNQHPSTTGDMDSCLVSSFQNSNSALSLHKDNEDLMCQTSSICTVSFGAARELEFVIDGKKKNKKPDRSTDVSLPATDRTMNIMKPGAQQVMKHRVKTGTRVSGGPNWRYSISFRKIAKPGTNTLPSSPPKMTINPPKASQSPSSPTTNTRSGQQQKKYANLIAGDSFTARLDKCRLGKGKEEVHNISKGGSKISDVQQSLIDFSATHPLVTIKKVFLSVGTNDIRHCRNGVQHLKNSVGDLMKCTKELFPDAKVFVQSIPPIHPNGCQYTVGNVLSMNNLLYTKCSRHKLFYLDIFGAFLDVHGYRNNRLFPPFDAKKQAFDIHPSAKKGMPVLARFYIRLIHSKWFNPLGY